MAYGDSDFFFARLKSLIPGGWFGVAPVSDALFGGLADDLAQQYGLLQRVKRATRISSATGWLLDLAALDFLGIRFLRRAGEGDNSFRPRVITEILRERVTRKGLVDALINLTGQTPTLLEMANPQDCGGGYSSLNGSLYGGIAYGHNGSQSGAGRYGSLGYPCQIFITAYRPSGQVAGIPNVSGYGQVGGGYSVGALAYCELSDVGAPVKDSDIYDAIAQTTAAGVVSWVAIANVAA